MRETITDESVQGLSHLKKIFAAFKKLAPVGTERDKPKNREQFFSQYASLVLFRRRKHATMTPFQQNLKSTTEQTGATLFLRPPTTRPAPRFLTAVHMPLGLKSFDATPNQNGMSV